MNRRRYLALSAGALSTVAGCGSAPGPADDSGPSPTPTVDAPEPTVAVATDRYLVRSYAQRPIDRAIETDQIVPLAEVDEPLHGALRTAVDSEYRTAEVSRALLSGIDRFRHNSLGYRFQPYVGVDGVPYAFDPTVPVFTAYLEFGVDDPDPARTIGQDGLGELSEPAEDFVRTMGAFTTHAPRDTYHRSAVPDAVVDFLDDYDYVHDPDGVGRIVTERVDPGPPYTITASRLTAEDLWGHPVLSAASLPAELRTFLEAVVASERRSPVYRPDRTEYRTDSLPPSYGDHLGPEHGPTFGPYVDLDGTLYAFRAMEIQREAMPITVGASVEDPRSFSVSVEPTSAGRRPAFDGPVELHSAGALPSVLWVVAGSERYLLDSDTYGDTWWSDEDGRLGGRIEETASATVASGESLSATYRIPDALPGESYTAWGLLRASWTAPGEDRPTPPMPYPFQVVLRVP